MVELDIWLLACFVAVGGSEVLFWKLITPKNLDLTFSPPKNEIRISRYIGKCENIFIVSAVMVEAYTALALLYSADRSCEQQA